MSPISFAGIGTYVLLIEGGLHLFGFDFPEGSVAEFVNGTLTVISFLMLLYGQLRRRDLIGGLIRRFEVKKNGTVVQ